MKLRLCTAAVVGATLVLRRRPGVSLIARPLEDSVRHVATLPSWTTETGQFSYKL